MNFALLVKLFLALFKLAAGRCPRVRAATIAVIRSSATFLFYCANWRDANFAEFELPFTLANWVSADDALPSGRVKMPLGTPIRTTHWRSEAVRRDPGNGRPLAGISRVRASPRSTLREACNGR